MTNVSSNLILVFKLLDVANIAELSINKKQSLF